MKPLYLALSGGGAHAAAHAGVLRALEREGVPVAGIAGGERGVAGGRRLGGRRRPRRSWWSRPRACTPGCGCAAGAGGCSPAAASARSSTSSCPSATFEGLRVPLVVLATDVDTGEAVVFREGSLRDAVRASCSFPGVFPPFVVERPAARRRGHLRGGARPPRPRDGGGAGVVVAIDCNAGGRWPAADSFVAIALRAGLTLLRGRTRSELVGADLVIAPAIGESGWMRPTRIPSFAAAGEDALATACRSCGGCSRPEGAAMRRALARLGLALLLLGALYGALALHDRAARRSRLVARRRLPRGPVTRRSAATASATSARARARRRPRPRLRLLALHLEGRDPGARRGPRRGGTRPAWLRPVGPAGRPVVRGLPAAVLGLMDRLGIERAALVGNSMGGATVAVVAAEHPRAGERPRAGGRGGVQPGTVGAAAHGERRDVARRRAARPPAGQAARGGGVLRQVFHDAAHVTPERVAGVPRGRLPPGHASPPSARSGPRPATGRPSSRRRCPASRRRRSSSGATTIAGSRSPTPTASWPRSPARARS